MVCSSGVLTALYACLPIVTTGAYKSQRVTGAAVVVIDVECHVVAAEGADVCVHADRSAIIK